VSGFLFDAFLRSIAFALVAMVVLAAARRKSASIQHAIGVVALSVILLLPLLAIRIPQVGVPVLASDALRLETTSARVDHAPGLKANTIVHAREDSTRKSTSGWVILWEIGVAVVVGRYVVGLLTILRWTLNCHPIDATGGVRIWKSDSVGVPMTAWLGSHVILLPSTSETWDQSRRQLAIQHELAHVRRNDWWTQMLGQMACALFWPNPLVWILSRRCRSLAERAADDLVLSDGVVPARYAQDLLEIAREIKATYPEASVCMAGKVDVARRIEMILKTKIDRGAVRASNLVLPALALITLAAPVASVALTHRLESRQPRAASAKVGVEKTRIVIETNFLSAGLTMANSGLIGPNLTDRSNVVVVSDQVARDAIKRWKKEKRIVSSPRIFTLSGMEAVVNVQRHPEISDSIHITPTFKSGMMNLDIRYEAKEPTNPVTAYQMTFSTSTPLASNIVISLGGRPGHPAEVLAMVKATVVASDAP